MAKIYTDNPRILTFDEQYQQQFELFPGSYNYVTYKLRSFKPAIEKVRINCVDNFSKELVQGWTIQVHTNPIVPNQTFPVHLQLHKNEILPPLPFDNKLDMPVTYEIESADPDIVQVIERFVKIDANSRNFIKLRALGQNKTGQREAYVYISSSEGAAGECWKLMLTISP